MKQEQLVEGKELSRYVTPLVAWALAFGSSIGWGSFVMPGTTFLPIAGPLGSVLGLAVGAVAVLIIGVSYHYLMNHYTGAGGAFTYAKKTFGYDHGFLCAWFLSLTYVAVIWANATALPLIGRSLIGNLFQFGFTYEIAGFQVYFGEIALAIAALCIAALACLRSRVAGVVQIVMAFVLMVGICICFVGVGSKFPIGEALQDTGNLEGSALILGFFNVVALAPWAFVGFESISHSSGEFRFSPKKSLSIMAVAVAIAALGYILLAIIASSTQPAGCAGWADYIGNLGSYEGIEGFPTFYAIQAAMGDTGRFVVALAALGGVVTGLIGCFVASSRLLYSMANDGLLPAKFGKVNSKGAPANAILAILAVSVFIPFIGRAATSWIVDVTTVGATIAYAYTSACAFKIARDEKQRLYLVFAVMGLIASALFMLSFLVPNILEIDTLSVESYLILAIWSVLGFVFFRHFFKKDKHRRLGVSAIAWAVLLGLILYTSLVWIHQSMDRATEQAAVNLQETYALVVDGQQSGSGSPDEAEVQARITSEMNRINDSVWVDNLIQMALIVVSLIFTFDIYAIMQKRESKAEVKRALAEESSRAKTSFLSNMSHEIRTPMNAIIGLDNIALQDPDLSPRTREQLEKIGGSAKHLLGLINDILDMSRIESGRMVLKDEEFALKEFLDQINIMINGQCEDKGLAYECRIIGHVNDYYVGDDMKLKQVLINILGNSVKFTNPPGVVTFTVEQISHYEGMCTLRFTMKDTGIGMDKEYLPTIFDAFSQEDATTTNAYGGSGLGMAITKNLVEMMNGEIAVESEKGVGTTFTVTVTLKVSSRDSRSKDASKLPEGLCALVVDDDGVACEHAVLVLSDIGIKADGCMDPAEALKRMDERRQAGNPYDLVMTDYRMPDIDGIELTKRIREVDDAVMVIILSGYSVDDVTDQVWGVGADGLLSKPLFTDTLRREILSVLRKKAEGDEGTVVEESEQGEDLAVLVGRRVLLAEDVDINAEIMMDILDMEDVVAERAENGQIAVDMFAASAEGYYDAVLMDVRMPVLDGLGATAAIRKLDRPDAKTVPIIALTANAFDEDVQRSLQAGMNAHLSKPVEPNRLFDTLAQLIGEMDKD